MDTRTEHEEELEDQEEELSGQMSFLDHLEELRRRILNVLIAVGIAFCITWFFVDQLFGLFSRLIIDAGGELNQTKLTEAFTLQLKLAVLAAIFLAAPFILAQVWLFISPGLYRHERRYALPFVFFSSLLFIIGGLFAYTIALPFAIPFLINMGAELELRTLLGVSDAFDLVFAIMLGMGVVFEIPALIFLLSRLGLVTGSFLLKNTKYAVLGSFIAAAVITPTGDIPNMMVLAGPMIALYMVGVGVAFVFGKKREKVKKK